MITSASDICKVGYSTMNGRLRIIIFDKYAFEFLVRIFGAFFLNQVGPSELKVGGLHKFERAHWCDVFTIMIKQYKPFQFYIVIKLKQKRGVYVSKKNNEFIIILPVLSVLLTARLSDSSKSIIDILMLFISSIIPISLARNKGSVFVPFITTSVCKSFVLNAFTISIFGCCNTILYVIYLSSFI